MNLEDRSTGRAGQQRRNLKSFGNTRRNKMEVKGKADGTDRTEETKPHQFYINISVVLRNLRTTLWEKHWQPSKCYDCRGKIGDIGQ